MSLDDNLKLLVARIRAQFNTQKGLIDGKEPTLPSGGTTAQYLRGDKTWTDYAQTTNAGFVNSISTANHVLSGLQTVGGVGVGAGGRVLLNAQTDGKENGIWVCSSGAWVRGTDANTSLRLAHYVATVSQGPQIGMSYQTTFKSTDTIGTNNIRFYSTRAEMVSPLTFPVPAGHGHHVLDLTNEMPYYYDAVGLTWVSANGVMQRTNAQRLAMTTVARDVIVRETDTGLTYMWDGAAWQLQSSPSASDLSAGTIPDARLPARIGPVSPNYVAGDLNLAVDNGWYAAPAGAANSPLSTGYFNVLVSQYYGYGYATQQAFEVSTGGIPKMFIRQQQGGTWGAWRPLAYSEKVGTVKMWYGAKADIEPGWLAMDGATFSAATYPLLNTLLGGTTLPNLTDRFVRGVGASALGATGGSATDTLPAHVHPHAHTHTLPDHTHSLSISNNARVDTGSASRTNSPNTGNPNSNPASGGASVANTSNPTTSPTIDTVPPFLAMWYIIKAA